MRKALLLGFGIVIALIGLILVAPSLIPSATLKSQITTRASEALGRTVSVDGDIRISVFPRVTVSASGARIANAPGFGEHPLAQVDTIRLNVGLFALLGGTLDVQDFVFIRPTLALETKANGNNNWTFVPNSTAVNDTQIAAEVDTRFIRQPGTLPMDARLGHVAIVDGSGTLFDAATGQTTSITKLNVKLSLDAINAPLTVDTSLVLDGISHTAKAEIGSLQALLEGDETPLTLRYQSDLAKLKIDGAIVEGTDFAFTGDTALTVPSVRALAEAGGTVLPEGDIYQRAEITGVASGDINQLRFSNAAARLDDIEVDGDLTLTLTGPRPTLTGTITMGDADITPYAPAAPQGEAERKPDGDVGWGDEPLDLSPLSLIDAQLTAQVGQVTFGTLQAGPGAVDISLDAGRLTFDLTKLDAYGGAMTGSMVVNARTTPASFAFDADLSAINAQPLLQAAAGLGLLAGQGDMTVSLTSSGDTVEDMMNALRGTGQFRFADGTISGADFAALSTGLKHALDGTLSVDTLLNRDRQAQAETPFDALTARFTLDEGLAKTSDLAFTNPKFTVNGIGGVNLADQSVALDLAIERPQAHAGGETLLDTTGIPITIAGPWGDIGLALDRDALTALGRQAAAEAARDRLSDQLGNPLGDDAGAVLDTVLDGEVSTQDAAKAILNVFNRPGDE